MATLFLAPGQHAIEVDYVQVHRSFPSRLARSCLSTIGAFEP